MATMQLTSEESGLTWNRRGRRWNAILPLYSGAYVSNQYIQSHLFLSVVAVQTTSGEDSWPSAVVYRNPGDHPHECNHICFGALHQSETITARNV